MCVTLVKTRMLCVLECFLMKVLDARDRYLCKGGAILPDVIQMKIAGASESATGLSFWKVNVFLFHAKPGVHILSNA